MRSPFKFFYEGGSQVKRPPFPVIFVALGSVALIAANLRYIRVTMLNSIFKTLKAGLKTCHVGWLPRRKGKSGAITASRAVYVPFPVASSSSTPAKYFAIPSMSYIMTQVLTSADFNMGNTTSLTTPQTNFSVQISAPTYSTCVGSPPTSEFICVGGAWSAFAPTVTSGTDFTISGATIVFGNLSIDSIVFSGNASLVVSGCIASSNLTVVLNLTESDISNLPSAEQSTRFPRPYLPIKPFDCFSCYFAEPRLSQGI